MADFNPTPQPTQDPNWLFYSREDRGPPPVNESGAILAEGSGKVFEAGAKLLDQQQEQNVKNKVFDIEENEREGFISAASTLKNQQDASGYQNNPSNQPSILAQNSVDQAPTQVQRAIQNVQTIKGAYDGGKINENMYYQRVIPQLQQVRNDYPGYRDVVDSALGNTANAYMRSLVTELNERQSNVKAQHDRNVSEALSMAKEGYLGPNGMAVVQARSDGTMDDATFYKTAAPFIAQSYRMKALRDSLVTQEITDKKSKDVATQYANESANRAASAAAIWPVVTARSGMQAGGMSVQAHADAIVSQMNNPETINPVQAAAHQRAIEAYVATTTQSIYADLNQPLKGDPQGRSVATILGPEQTKAIIAAHMEPLRAIGDMVQNHAEHGLGVVGSDMIRMTKDSDEWGTMTDPKTMGAIRGLQTLQRAVGPAAIPDIVQTLLGSGTYSDTLKSVFNREYVNLLTQPDPTNPSSIGEATAYMKTKGIQVPQLYKGLVDQIGLFTRPDVGDEAKLNIAKGFFSPTPENRQFISNFAKNTYDPATQRYINGADTIFQQLTSPAVTRQVMHMKDAQLSQDYQNTADVWFNNVFGREMSNLRDAMHDEQTYKSRGVTISKTPEIKLAWDNVNHELDVSPDARAYLQKTRQYSTLQSLDRVNMGLRNMGHIVETVGAAGYPRDFNAYMIQLLNTEGLDPKSKETVEAIKNAILASGKQKTEAE